jgi:ribosomal protein L11 methyltransferase
MEIKKYINIHVKILEEYYELAYALLYYFPFTGIEERFDELIISFELDNWIQQIRNQLHESLIQIHPKAEIIKEEILDEKNWNEEWEKKVPITIISDKIAITPEWRQNQVEREIKILINPKMSFGTGDHQSTRLVCRLMENVVKKDSFWIDAGTGTGILAVLAIKLGAQKVLATDNNIWSYENAAENFKLNNVDSVIELKNEDVQSATLPAADGIVANLNLNLILSSLNIFYNSLKANKGDLIIAGILIYNKEDILKAASQSGFIEQSHLIEDEWIAFHFKAN